MIEENLEVKYRRLIGKWIHIYGELMELKDATVLDATLVSSEIPFNYGKPQTIAAACCWAAGKRQRDEISISEMLKITQTSMGSFWKMRKKLMEKKVI